MNTHTSLRFACAVILLTTPAIAKNANAGVPLPDSLRKVVLIQPTGEKIDLYFLAQIYLKNRNEIAEIEPAYIALTKNQGGFAKFGFQLLDGGTHVDKSKAPYVDITADNATARPDKLMSLTQLYPHELGHILYRLLSASESREEESKNVDMHYFSAVFAKANSPIFTSPPHFTKPFCMIRLRPASHP
jgi:hypothetical protein